MYSATPQVGALWRRLLASALAPVDGAPVEIVEHAPPAPIAELWQRPDKAAVFMCGLPLSCAEPRPAIVAAPVPSPAAYGGRACYWTDLVVRADSPFTTLEQTFDHRLALTTPELQSGYAASLHALMPYGSARPLYREVVAPTFTPMGALMAVIDRRAEVAPLDSYALALLQRHAPELTPPGADRERHRADRDPCAGRLRARRRKRSLPHSSRCRPGGARTVAARSASSFRRRRPTTQLRMRFETMGEFWRRHPLAVTPASATFATSYSHATRALASGNGLILWTPSPVIGGGGRR